MYMGTFDLVKLDDDLITCDGAFTAEEIEKIRKICDALSHTGSPDISTGDGVSRKTWLTPIKSSPTTQFFYRRIGEIAKSINDEYFKLDIDGFISQGIWYNHYSLPTDHYDWHTDKTRKYGTTKDFVKQTVVLQLSSPEEYEGGYVDVMIDGIIRIERRQGLIYSIPGWVPHQVTNIVSGHRRTLVAWFTGPRFR